MTLPALAIQSVHRSDDSGTTDNFVKWLKAAAPADWTYDTGKTWVAPGGVAGQGNDGVGKEVKNTSGAVGYVEWGFALDQGLSIAKIDNGAGAVELTGEAASKTVEAAQVVGTGKALAAGSGGLLLVVKIRSPSRTALPEMPPSAPGALVA